MTPHLHAVPGLAARVIAFSTLEEARIIHERVTGDLERDRDALLERIQEDARYSIGLLGSPHLGVLERVALLRLAAAAVDREVGRLVLGMQPLDATGLVDHLVHVAGTALAIARATVLDGTDVGPGPVLGEAS